MKKTVLYFRALDIVRACVAIKPCISNEANRTYLHGICIDRDPLNPKGAVFVSTNGHTLGLYRCEPLGDGESLVDLFKMPDVRAIIPTLAVEVLAKVKLPARDAELTVMRLTFEMHDESDMEGEKGYETLKKGTPPTAVLVELVTGEEEAAQSWRWALVDGNFPDWQRVQPFDLPPVKQAFQALYVEQLAKAAGAADRLGKLPRAYGITALALQVQEEFPSGPARLLTDVPGLSYVIMPVRAGAEMEIEEGKEPADWQTLQRAALMLSRLSRLGKTENDRKALDKIEADLMRIAARQPGYTGKPVYEHEEPSAGVKF